MQSRGCSKKGFKTQAKPFLRFTMPADTIEFHAVTSAFVSVAVLHNFKYFDVTDNVLDTDSKPGKPSGVRFFLSV